MHLNAEQLVDLAEGTQPESAAPHLAGCATCRAQVDELRAMLTNAREVDVPEPSPLFWDHLSARISDAIAAESGQPRRSSRLLGLSEGGRAWMRTGWFQASVVVAAALLIAVALGTRATAPGPLPTPASVVVVEPGIEQLSDWTPDRDASLTVVASLTDDVDLETAREAGLAPHGSAEHAVTHMSDGELRELRRLLKEELGSGA